MRLVKHTHATVTLHHDGGMLLIDPGSFTANAAALLAEADAVLVTHDHPDHLDVDALRAEMARRPELPVHVPASVAASLEGTLAASDGDTFEAAGLTVTAHGHEHAEIHPDVEVPENVAYLVGGVYHPGDSYHAPEGVVGNVDLLLVPTSGPWSVTGKAADFVRAVKPGRCIQLHDLMLSPQGKGSIGTFLQRITGMEVPALADGESVEL
ncbi:MBL fold metallo-hydrolase [Nocardioides sp. GY 10127]|uniref:MBL fold metallo-hydrolase n=1 Tax=Nocardioides sp. GY 10127 TaxID=2569762 RepID=UPI0010A86E1B|nr:MBL fold metallo-hydrolase [Nocardioides sp. GY 10127]TIC84503.1 MBL fold metallo-hydrolase [Nocardioides sp. GY 10127]